VRGYLEVPGIAFDGTERDALFPRLKTMVWFSADIRANLSESDQSQQTNVLESHLPTSQTSVFRGKSSSTNLVISDLSTWRYRTTPTIPTRDNTQSTTLADSPSSPHGRTASTLGVNTTKTSTGFQPQGIEPPRICSPAHALHDLASTPTLHLPPQPHHPQSKTICQRVSHISIVNPITIPSFSFFHPSAPHLHTTRHQNNPLTCGSLVLPPGREEPKLRCDMHAR
jgi:hypothetical protein